MRTPKGYYPPYDLSFGDICSALANGTDVRVLLPSLVREQLLGAGQQPAIGDVAGRDAAAAIIVAFAKGIVPSVLPVIDVKPVQYGDYSVCLSNVEYSKDRIAKAYGGVVYDAISVGDPEFWWLLNGRYIGETFRRFGFYSPCAACHLYFHTIRAALAKALGSNILVSGGRDTHDGKRKISQFPSAIDLFRDFLRDEFGVTHLQPVRSIDDGGEIERIVGKPWEQGGDQLQCVFSRNYEAVDRGQLLVEEWRVIEYLREFAIPVTRAIVQARLRGDGDLEAAVRPICRTVFSP